MNELRQLVMRYVGREIDFLQFRRAFVEQFLTTASNDTAVWQTVVQIESDCADFSERMMAEEQLRPRLVSLIQAQETKGTASAVSIVANYTVVSSSSVQPPVIAVVAA